MIGYRGIHNWIERKQGKPKLCSDCGSSDPDKIFQWANISGEYKRDISDWVRLCITCHFKRHSEERKFCPNGHKYTKENTYHLRGGNNRSRCKTCKRLSNIRYHARKKKITI